MITRSKAPSPVPFIFSHDGQAVAPDSSMLNPCAVFLPSCAGNDGNQYGSTKDWRRARILAATRSMVEERGFDNVNVRPLARRAGVTPPTIYNLIGRRQHVLHYAIEEGIDAKWRLAIQKSEAEGILPILAYVDVLSRAMEIYPRYYKQVMKNLFDTNSGRERKLKLTSRINDIFSSWLDIMAQNGQIKQTALSNETVAALLSTQLAEGTIEWCRCELDFTTMRGEIILGVALILLAIVTRGEANKIELWLSTLPS